MRGIGSGRMNSAPVATVTAVTFIVAFAPVLCGLAQKTVNAVTGDCSGEKKDTQEANVKMPNTTLTLKCKEGDTNNVTPKFNTDNFQLCTDQECDHQQRLSDYIPGATVEKAAGVEAEVHINNLPQAQKTFYIRCGAKGPSACVIKVVVAKAASETVEGGSGHPGVPGGVPGSAGGVTSGSPLSCAKAGGSITIKIPEKGSTAQFKCGDMTLYPRDAERVFAEDCKKEESLKDIVRSDKGDVYTLTAAKKPPKKKWCYLCASSHVSTGDPGRASDYCVVHVESSSRTQSGSAIALAALLSCVLHMLRIT